MNFLRNNFESAPKSLKNKIHPKDILKISGKNLEVIAGGEIQDRYRDKVDYKDNRPDIQFIQVPGFGHVEYEFVVSGRGNVKIEFESMKATNQSTEIKL